MKTFLKAIKLEKLPKLWWAVLPAVAFIFLIFYGVTNYINVSNEKEPRWMLCEPDKGNRKPLYVKFHNTDKIQWDHGQGKWIKSRYEGLRETMPTIEMHEDKFHFSESRFQWKLIPIYQSNKYYVFYQKLGGSKFIPGMPPDKVMGQHIIINRDDFSLLDYKNEWVKDLLRERKYNDGEIDKLFKEVNSYVLPFEYILLFTGKTLVAERSLDNFKCKEIAVIKPKI